MPAFLRVRSCSIIIPLEQGLRLERDDVSILVIKFYHHSIRTRIKTKLDSLRSIISIGSIIIPLEQGLRLPLNTGTGDYIYSIAIPLEQGLRLLVL